MTERPVHSPLGASGAEHTCEYVAHPTIAVSACRCGSVWNTGAKRVAKARADKDGYLLIDADKKTLKVHRIVAACFFGENHQEVDHKDRNRSNNALENLEYKSQSANRRNVGVRKHSSSGIRNVRYRKDRGKWQAYCNRDGRFKSLGYYTDVASAEAIAKEHYHVN